MCYESSRSTSRKDAEYLLTCRKKAVGEGKTPEIKRIKNYSFSQLAEEYLRWAERQRCFPTKKVLVGQLVAVFGNYPLRGFNSRLIEQYQTERLQRNKPATVNRFLATLKHMFTKAVEWEMVEEDSLKKVRRVKLLKEPPGRLRFLSKKECHALIGACISHLKPIVVTALHTGMRKGEILGLKWEHVDFRHGFILLDNTKNGERREIYINDTLRATLEGIPHGLESEYVFTDRNGRPFKEVKKSFATALSRAGVKDFRFHDLRHTFASHLVMAGKDITSVKKLLGHKSLNMTLRYSHLAPSHLVSVVKVLDEKIGVSEDSADLLDSYMTVEQESQPTPSCKSL
jgi:integrase